MPIFPSIRTIPSILGTIPDIVIPTFSTVTVSQGPMYSAVTIAVAQHVVDQNGVGPMNAVSTATNDVNSVDASENQSISQLRVKNPVTGA